MRTDVGLAYDDVLLVPKRSRIAHRGDVSTKTKLSRHITLNIPFVSANMDTVTESKMAIALAREGGIGMIHRFMTISRQVEEVKKVKRFEGFMVDNPFTLRPDATLKEALELMNLKQISGFLIVDNKEKLLGVLSRRDMLFVDDFKIPVHKLMTPFAKLITAGVSVKKEEARKLLQKYKVEKLPVIDEKGILKGLITSRSLESLQKHPYSAKDRNGSLLVGAAVGAVGDYVERSKALLDAGADVLIVDVAHGHNEVAISAIATLRKKYKDAELIGGNIATPEAAFDLIKMGVDSVKVGIGPGGLCTTRIVAGVGVPQWTAVKECSTLAKKYKIPVIADGGTNHLGDITKALAVGGSCCMLAGWFAGTDESPGEIIMRKGMKYKAHRGSASFLAVADRKIASSSSPSAERLNTIVAEGVEALIPYKGRVSDVIYQLLGGLRSGMSYCNASKIEELWKNAEFVRITEAGLRESKSHNVEEI